MTSVLGWFNSAIQTVKGFAERGVVFAGQAMIGADKQMIAGDSQALANPLTALEFFQNLS
jgi:hypothetical protein